MTSEPQNIDEAIVTLVDAASSSSAPAIEEKELVRRVLQFANTGQPKGLPGVRTAEHGGQSFVLLPPDVEKWQVELRKDLGSVIKDELSGPAAARLRKQAARQVMVPVFQFERGALQISYRHFVGEAEGMGLQTVLAFVVLRVLSNERLREDVKQCRLAGCERFFLASDELTDSSAPGRRRYRYCSPEHMAKAQTSGAERTRRWREKSKKLTPAKHK
jgi:hypothetical protein